LLPGEPVALSAQQVRGGGGVDTRLSAVLRFADDVLATIDCGFDVAAREGLEVAGTRGVLRLEDPWRARKPGIELRRADGSVTRIAVESRDPYACELEDF